MVLLIFHGFLRQSFFGGSFWNFVQALVLGFAMYYAGTWAIQALERLLAGQFTIYNNETLNDLIFENRYVMLAVSVVFAPVIEETLVRGVVFGTIRPASRVLAYIVSALLFTLMHNWQYFGLHPFLSILLSCLPYIPASVALAWVYEKAGTIWAPITLHALINAVCRQLVVLLPAAWLLAQTGKLEMVWFCFPIAEIFSFTLSAIFLRKTLQTAHARMLADNAD